MADTTSLRSKRRPANASTKTLESTGAPVTRTPPFHRRLGATAAVSTGSWLRWSLHRPQCARKTQTGFDSATRHCAAAGVTTTGSRSFNLRSVKRLRTRSLARLTSARRY